MMYRTIITKDDKVVAVRATVWTVYFKYMEIVLPAKYTIEDVLRFIKNYE